VHTATMLGSFVYQGDTIAATGAWGPEGVNVDYSWQTACCNPWIQSSMLPMSFPEGKMLEMDLADKDTDVASSPSSKKTGSVSGSSTPPPEPRRQSAARAAKRQRGRERRKLYKAAAHVSRCLESERDRLALAFEARTQRVAEVMRLVVNQTFVDVVAEDSDEDEILLPEAFFASTPEIDSWRRDYRRFRLGQHQGAKGEVTEKDLILQVGSLSGLDLRNLDVRSRPCLALAA